MPTQEKRAAPPSEEQVRAAHRPVVWFSVVLLAALWLSLAQPPWPLPLVPGLLALLAIGLGVLGLVRLRRARIGGGTAVLVVVGLGIAAAMVFFSTVQAVMWPVYSDFYGCLDRALTHQAQDACLTDLEQRTQSLLFDLVR